MNGSNIILEGNAYNNFVDTIKSKKTLQTYKFCIEKFMLFCGITDIENLLVISQDPKEIQRKIIDYVMALRDREMSTPAINMYVASIVHFYAMNDVTLNRKKIGKYFPPPARKQKDMAYTREEIARLLYFCDTRSKAMVLLFASTGMRIGAVPDLRLEHLQRIEKYSLYQFTVYDGYANDEYICFCTPECRKAIDRYLQYREHCGEILTPKSPLFREQFDVTDLEQIRKKGKPISEETIVMVITKAQHLLQVIQKEHLKEGEKAGKKRKPIMRTHGFRKFVETTFTNLDLNDSKREMLLGHGLPGQREAYYRPNANDLLQEYLKAVDALTINEENRLKRRVEQLTIRADKLDELEQQMNRLTKKLGLEQ